MLARGCPDPSRIHLKASVVLLASLMLLSIAARSHADCGMSPLGGVQEGNVVWGLKDSLSACPAGDSVLAGHPCRLRIALYYFDSNCNPKVGVPPESIWVTIQSTTGNLKVNDEGAKVFADDSTDGAGLARITVPSFSGFGSVTVRLTVSGAGQGNKTASVRTADFDASGRVTLDDYLPSPPACDLNYDGSKDNNDRSLVLPHAVGLHWHRNALFGTPVRRTMACSYCPPRSLGTLGGDYSWSPNGRMFALSIFDTNYVGGNDCTINLVPADPSVGNLPARFTNPPAGFHDYSPAWSPVGDRIYWERQDSDIIYKGIWGQSTDTTTHTLSISGILANNTLEDTAISPDGNTIAFHNQVANGGFRIFTVPVSGGQATRITPDTAGIVYDQFPRWSPDGTTIVFYRQTYPSGNTPVAVVYKVPASGGTLIILVTRQYCPCRNTRPTGQESRFAAILQGIRLRTCSCGQCGAI